MRLQRSQTGSGASACWCEYLHRTPSPYEYLGLASAAPWTGRPKKAGCRRAARARLIAHGLGVDQGFRGDGHSKLTTGLLNPGSDCIHSVWAGFMSESEHPDSVQGPASDHPVHRMYRLAPTEIDKWGRAARYVSTNIRNRRAQ
jgi:hypothetical protein